MSEFAVTQAVREHPRGIFKVAPAEARKVFGWAASHFALVEWQGIVRYLLPGGYSLHLVSRTLRRHMSAIIVVARKR